MVVGSCYGHRITTNQSISLAWEFELWNQQHADSSGEWLGWYLHSPVTLCGNIVLVYFITCYEFSRFMYQWIHASRDIVWSMQFIYCLTGHIVNIAHLRE